MIMNPIKQLLLQRWLAIVVLRLLPLLVKLQSLRCPLYDILFVLDELTNEAFRRRLTKTQLFIRPCSNLGVRNLFHLRVVELDQWKLLCKGERHQLYIAFVPPSGLSAWPLDARGFLLFFSFLIIIMPLHCFSWGLPSTAASYLISELQWVEDRCDLYTTDNMWMQYNSGSGFV